MENRFGIKDAFLFVSLAILAGLIILSMKQFDRQWLEVQTIRSQSDNLASDLNTIKTEIASLKSKIDAGVSLVPPPARKSCRKNSSRIRR